MPLVASKLGHLALFVAFWFAVYAGGRAAGKLLAGRRGIPPELETALGVVACVLLGFFLCAVHLAYGWLLKALIGGAAAAGAIAFRRDLARVPSRVKRWLEDLQVGTAALWAGAAALALPVALTAAEPPYFWDALTYHLAVPQAYLRAHGFAYLPYNVYASMPLGGTLFYLLPLSWDGLITANASHLVVSVIAVALTYRLARLWLPQFYAALAAALLFLTPVFFGCMGGAHADHFQIMFVAAALYAYFAAERREGGPFGRWPPAVGVFVGAALAVKYVALPAALAFVPIWVYDVARKRRRLGDVAVALGVAAAVAAPWLVKAYVERGNPVFPLLYGLFGGRDFSAEQAGRLMAWHVGVTGQGRDALDVLSLPYRIAVKSDAAYGEFMGIYLPFLLPLAALGAVLFRRGGRLVAYGWLHLLAWAFGSQQLRFLGSALPALATAAAGAVAAGDGYRHVWLRRLWRGALVVLVLGASFPYVSAFIYDSLPGHLYLAGMSRDDYVESKCRSYAATKFINAMTPADAKVLMVFTNHTLYLEREAIYDSFFEASPFLLAAERASAGRELYELARRWGATHVHVYHPYESQVWSFYDARARENFYDFLRRFTVVVYRDDANGVYEVCGEGP